MTTPTEPIAPTSTGRCYLAALCAGDLFADPVYEREPDTARVESMGAVFDRTRLGVVEVSARGDGRYAIIDGQHRWAAVKSAYGVNEHLVCQVDTGLNIADEARLRGETGTGRRTPTWWDRWRARRRAGDPAVLGVDEVLSRHHLQVNPAPEDGNIRATKTLECIVEDLGGLQLLDQVLIVVTCAFGSSVEAFDAAIMHGVALVLARYDPAELDTDRLVAQLRGIAPRQLRARATALREGRRDTLARLCAAVIIERYNAGRGRNVQPFHTGVASISSAGRTVHRDRACRTALRLPATRNGDDTAQARRIPPIVRCTDRQDQSAAATSPARPGRARRTRGDQSPTAVHDHRDAEQADDVEEDEESPEVGVPDRDGVRRALANGRGLRWVMDAYGLDYPTAKALRAEFAAA